MLAFLKHKFSKKDKILARWSASHMTVALVIGIVLAGWIVLNHQCNVTSRIAELQQNSSAEAAAPASNIPPNAGNIGGPFTLTDQDAKQVSDKDFSGKYLMIYFGYTSCPDMCPTGLQSMSKAMDDLKGQADKVQPLFITVDPARDTPQRLKEYDASFSPSIVGLTGTPEQIAAVAREYQVYYQKGEGNEDYTVDHSSVIYLISPQGKLINTFGEQADPTDIVTALQKAGIGG